MTIHKGTYIPVEYNKKKMYEYISGRCVNIKHSLRLVDIDNEHLEVRCPFSGEYVEITGTTEEVDWLHCELIRNDWYRTRD